MHPACMQFGESAAALAQRLPAFVTPVLLFVGSGLATFSGLGLSGPAGNYTLTFVPGTLAVGQNLLTITADNKIKTYGAALPGFTASFSGLVNGDTLTTQPTCTTTATAPGAHGCRRRRSTSPTRPAAACSTT